MQVGAAITHVSQWLLLHVVAINTQPKPSVVGFDHQTPVHDQALVRFSVRAWNFLRNYKRIEQRKNKCASFDSRNTICRRH